MTGLNQDARINVKTSTHFFFFTTVIVLQLVESFRIFTHVALSLFGTKENFHTFNLSKKSD